MLIYVLPSLIYKSIMLLANQIHTLYLKSKIRWARTILANSNSKGWYWTIGNVAIIRDSIGSMIVLLERMWLCMDNDNFRPNILHPNSKLNINHILNFLDQGESAAQISQITGRGLATIFRLCSKHHSSLILFCQITSQKIEHATEASNVLQDMNGESSKDSL